MNKIYTDILQQYKKNKYEKYYFEDTFLDEEYNEVIDKDNYWYDEDSNYYDDYWSKKYGI